MILILLFFFLLHFFKLLVTTCPANMSTIYGIHGLSVYPTTPLSVIGSS